MSVKNNPAKEIESLLREVREMVEKAESILARSTKHFEGIPAESGNDLEMIVTTIGRKFNLPRNKILSKIRYQYMVEARYAAICLSANVLHLHPLQIANFFNVSRSLVCKAKNTVANLCSTNLAFKRLYTECCDEINQRLNHD